MFVIMVLYVAATIFMLEQLKNIVGMKNNYNSG